jgi:hypothetical protein
VQRNTNREVTEVTECIRILNRFVLKEPLSDDELEVILRDEAFQKPVFFCDKTFLFDRFATWLNKIFDLRVFYEKGIDNLDTVIEEASHTIENMEMLFMGSVYDLAKFDEQDFVDEYLSECYAEAYDEKLDYYVDKAMSAASNAFAELAEEAKDEADMLLRQIEELETLAKKVLKLFKSLPLNDIRIDNTKK